MNKYIIPAVIALVISGIAGLFTIGVSQSNHASDSVVQGLSERDIQAVSIKVGPNGTKFDNLKGGICYIDPYAATIAASTTVSVDCQGTLAVDARAGNSSIIGASLDGVRSGDPVLVELSTTTAKGTFGALVLAGVSASTTVGHIELRVANYTGGTYTWPTTAGTASGTAMYFLPSL